MLSGSWDQNVLVWDIASEKTKLLKRIFVGSQVRCLRMSRFREKLIVGAFEGYLKFWDLSNLNDISIKCNLIVFKI